MDQRTFIFFEGIAGSGKSTTSQNISRTLKDGGFSHRLLREVDSDNPFVINHVPEEGAEFREMATKHWDKFLKERALKYPVWMMDNAFLQYPINALVWIDYPRDLIVEHILSIYHKFQEIDVKLVYFHGNSVREEVDRVLSSRGQDWLDKNIRSFVKNPFGLRHKDDPVEGIRLFFEDVVDVYEEAFKQLPLRKLLVNKSDLDWQRIEDEIHQFILDEKNS